MSSGKFVKSTYGANEEGFHQIKIQPETLAATFDGTANAAPEDDIDSGFAAEVNRGARAYGLRPRKVTVAFETTPPTGYRPYTTLSIPVLQQSVWDAVKIGDAVTYAGGTGVVSSKADEDVNPGDSAITVTAAQP